MPPKGRGRGVARGGGLRGISSNGRSGGARRIASSSSSSSDEEDQDQNLAHLLALLEAPGDALPSFQGCEHLLSQPALIRALLEAIALENKCAICLGVCSDPVTLANCAHTFCRECVARAVDVAGQRCPLCKSKASDRTTMTVEVSTRMLRAAEQVATSYLGFSDLDDVLDRCRDEAAAADAEWAEWVKHHNAVLAKEEEQQTACPPKAEPSLTPPASDDSNATTALDVVGKHNQRRKGKRRGDAAAALSDSLDRIGQKRPRNEHDRRSGKVAAPTRTVSSVSAAAARFKTIWLRGEFITVDLFLGDVLEVIESIRLSKASYGLDAPTAALTSSIRRQHDEWAAADGEGPSTSNSSVMAPLPPHDGLGMAPSAVDEGSRSRIVPVADDAREDGAVAVADDDGYQQQEAMWMTQHVDVHGNEGVRDDDEHGGAVISPSAPARCALCCLDIRDSPAVTNRLRFIVRADKAANTPALASLSEVTLNALLGPLVGPFCFSWGRRRADVLGRPAQTQWWAHETCLVCSSGLTSLFPRCVPTAPSAEEFENHDNNAESGGQLSRKHKKQRNKRRPEAEFLCDTPDAFLGAEKTLAMALSTPCDFCGEPGASVRCLRRGCKRRFHVVCCLLCSTDTVGALMADGNFLCCHHL